MRQHLLRRLHIALLAAIGVGVMGASATYADGDVTVIGGDAIDVVRCVNDGSGKQRNKCRANAHGGDVVLKDVDIHFIGRDPAMRVNGGAVSVLSVSGGEATAGAVCLNESSERTRRLSVCRLKAQGGRVVMRGVETVLHRADGTTRKVRRDLMAVGPRPAPRHAHCIGVSKEICDVRAAGATVAIEDVDVFDRATGVSRTAVDVLVRGGDATASVFCANFGGSGPVQMNRCSATASGGDATLRDVRLHVYER